MASSEIVERIDLEIATAKNEMARLRAARDALRPRSRPTVATSRTRRDSREVPKLATRETPARREPTPVSRKPTRTMSDVERQRRVEAGRKGAAARWAKARAEATK